MLTTHQLHTLQERVQTAIARIRALHEENIALKRKLSGYEKRVSDLEAHFSSVQEGQNEIEKGILSALDSLDQLENEFSSPHHSKEADSPPSEQPPNDASLDDLSI